MYPLYIGVFACISLLAYSMLAWLEERKYMRRRVNVYLSTSPGEMIEEELSFSERVVSPLWKKTKKNYQKRLNKEKESELEIRLLQAGQPFNLSPVEFKIYQLFLFLLLPAIGAGYGLLIGAEMVLVLLFAFAGTGASLIFPKHYLKRKAQKRSKLAFKELPDTIDLLTISLEGGLGFDAALSKVVSKKKGVLADEFKICLEEIRLGKTRKEALSNINNRIVLDELKSLVYNIVQAEKLGIGMVSVLRVQTEDIREKRRQKAEEAAMKAPVKMLFPLVLFIFPTLFIILLGPAVLQIIELF